MSEIKIIIDESLQRIRNGEGTPQDRAIQILLDHNRRFKGKIQDLERQVEELKASGGKEEVPLHHQKPWYM